MHAFRTVAALAAGLALAACATGFEQFYQPVPPSADSPGVLLSTEPPQVFASTGNPEADIAAMYTAGYAPIGFSVFNGPNEGVRGAIAQGKKIGAARVVTSAQYARTVAGALPITTPTSQTTNVSGTVYTPGRGYSFVNGRATTYGSQTTMVPYSVDRYDQTAGYFAEMQRKGYGFLQRDLNPDEARALGSAKGSLVVAVRRGSPAYDADVLPGDVLRLIDGQAFSRETYSTATRWGAPHAFTFMRDGKERQVTLQLGQTGEWR